MTAEPLPIQRRNRASQGEEAWRPPLFPPRAAARSRRWRSLAGAARRFFDLQAGTIWRDLSRILPAAHGNVLDVGCGAQPYRSLLPEGVHYAGMDTAEARSRFGYGEPDTIYYSGAEWPIEGQSVDLIVCTETLEHVPDPALFLREAFRCLRPGGRALFTVPFSARYHFIPHDYWRFTPAGLTRHLVAAGFDEIAIYARGTPLTVACYKVMALTLQLEFPANIKGLRLWLSRLAGFLTLPAFLLGALIANLSLQQDWGDDCLGYTVLAARPAAGLDQKPP